MSTQNYGKLPDNWALDTKIGTYTVGEYRAMYRDAKRPEEQIKIISDLSGLSMPNVYTILGMRRDDAAAKARPSPAKQYTKWTPERCEKLIELRESGLAWEAIGKELGVAGKTAGWKYSELKIKAKRATEAKKTDAAKKKATGAAKPAGGVLTEFAPNLLGVLKAYGLDLPVTDMAVDFDRGKIYLSAAMSSGAAVSVDVSIFKEGEK